MRMDHSAVSPHDMTIDRLGLASNTAPHLDVVARHDRVVVRHVARIKHRVRNDRRSDRARCGCGRGRGKDSEKRYNGSTAVD